MNSATNSEGTNRPPRSRRFGRSLTAPAFQPSHHHDAESPIRGVRTLSSVLQQVLLEIAQGGKP